MKPGPLQPGDTIGLVAPASPIDEGTARRAAEALRRGGFRVKLSKGYLEARGYLAASDEVRAGELERFFADPEVKAIFCLRGGYGTPRLLDRLDYDLLRGHPKILLGYSDITALLTAIRARCGMVVFHGPMAGEIAEGAYSARDFWEVFRPQSPRFADWGAGTGEERVALVEGIAEGILTGGNLSVLTCTLGTPYEVDTREGILFLEEVNEKAFRIDRMLNHLRLSGKLAVARGVLLGSFSGCGGDGERDLREIFLEYLGGLGVPVLAGFPAGHAVRDHVPLPLGVRVRLDAGARRLSLLEAPVSPVCSREP